MKKELYDYLFINAVKYKESMRKDDCLPEGVHIVNMEHGDLATVKTPMGTILVKEGDYILTTPDGKYYVCDKNYYHNIRIHPELNDIIDIHHKQDLPAKLLAGVLDYKILEVSTIYILNNTVIKIRPGFKGTIQDAIINHKGVYIQYSNGPFKMLHVYESNMLENLNSRIECIKSQSKRDLSENIIIYKRDDINEKR